MSKKTLAPAVTGTAKRVLSDQSPSLTQNVVQSALDNLSETLLHAETSFTDLSGRLTPIKRDTEKPAGSGRPSPEPSCALEERIMQLTHRVSVLNDCLIAEHNHLCI